MFSEGNGRGMVYYLPWRRGAPAMVFDLADLSTLSPQLGTIPPELGTIPLELGAIPPELAGQAPEVTAYLTWAEVPLELQNLLTELARPVSEARRVQPQYLRAIVSKLCNSRYLGRHVLAHLLQRNADDLLKRILSPMVESGQLKPAYAVSRDPRQAYIAATNPLNRPIP